MRCPQCGNQEDRVIDSRSSKDGGSIRRRRECIGCLHRYTTYEEIERVSLRVIKRDGRNEPFDRHKLINGMLKACEKRPISTELVEQTAASVAAELESEGSREIASSVVGAKVMEKLHALDQVAYVRYASVYRHFKDVGDFVDEIQNMGRRIPRSTRQPELFK